jgi:hypothetical protein
VAAAKVEIVLWEAEMEPFSELLDDTFRIHFDVQTTLDLALKLIGRAVDSEIINELYRLWQDDSHKRSYKLLNECVVITTL